MELLLEPDARKILLLQNAQSEVLVSTSAHIANNWSPELTSALKACAQRGLRVKLLLDDAGAIRASLVDKLLFAGVDIRQSHRKLSWLYRKLAVQGEFWVMDREQAVSMNQRLSRMDASVHTLSVECLMGPEVALGAATYFELRWEAEANPVAYSVRHKNYAFHSGKQAEVEFFGCLLAAQKEVTISLPGSRISRRVEAALHVSLQHGLQVTIFANADSDNSAGLRRLRRLAAAGAIVKICGRRLRSECLVVDSASVFMGSLPGTWSVLSRGTCPAFHVQDSSMSREILDALETQVSIEINGTPASSFYAYR